MAAQALRGFVQTMLKRRGKIMDEAVGGFERRGGGRLTFQDGQGRARVCGVGFCPVQFMKASSGTLYKRSSRPWPL